MAETAGYLRSEEYLANCRRFKSALTRRDRDYLKRYGITGADYDMMLKSQNDACGICQTPAEGAKKAFAVDHCHETGRVRGLLCSNCNTALGLLKDDRTLLWRASRWLMTDEELGIK